MLGSNTERAIQVIDKIIQSTAKFDLNIVAYRLSTSLVSGNIVGSTGTSSGRETHDHSAGGLAVGNIKANEDPYSGTIQNISDLKPLKSEYDSLMSKIQLIDKNIYVKNTSMHNSIGSPYTEMYRLQDILNEIVSFSVSCEYLGEYVLQVAKATSLIARAMQLAVDAKWAVISYSDYLERGYNYVQGQDPGTTR